MLGRVLTGPWAPRGGACATIAVPGRVEVCLLNAETSAAAAELMDGTRLERRVLVKVDLHLWTAPGHEALARRLSTALRELAASGELASAVEGRRGP